MFGRTQRANRKRLLALDAMRAKVMVSDADLNIVYINPAMRDFLERAEDDLRQDLPRFSVATMIGSKLDIFQKDPAQQSAMLAQLEGTQTATVAVGAHAFDLLATPLMVGSARRFRRGVGRRAASPEERRLCRADR